MPPAVAIAAAENDSLFSLGVSLSVESSGFCVFQLTPGRKELILTLFRIGIASTTHLRPQKLLL